MSPPPFRMTHRLTGRLRPFLGPLPVRLPVLAVGLLAVIVLVLFQDAGRQLERGLRPQVEALGRTVAQTAAGHLEQALDLGLPLAGLRGMEAFLDGRMAPHPDLRYLAVTDPAGEVLYHAGASLGAAADHFTLNDPLRPAAADTRADDLGEVLDIAAPLMRDGRLVGRVHVGIDADFADRAALHLLPSVLAVVVMAAVALVELLRLLMALGLAAPLDLQNAVLRRIEHGDFRHHLPVARMGRLKDLAERVNAVVDLVNNLYRGLAERAESYRRDPGQGLKLARRRLIAALRQIHDRYVFPESRPPAPFTDGHVVPARAVLFLAMVAESLSWAYLPPFAAALPWTTDPNALSAGPARSVAAALPVALFMAVAAVAFPLAGRWARRRGSRPVVLAGLGLMALGCLGGALAPTLPWLLAARAVAGAGFALATMAGLREILILTQTEPPAQGMGVTLGVLSLGLVCGPAAGGLLADSLTGSLASSLGPRLPFLVALVPLALAAGVLWRSLAARREVTPAAPGLAAQAALLTRPRFLALALFGILPGRVLTGALVLYAIPLALPDLGLGRAAVGQVLLVQALVAALALPLGARLAEGPGWRARLVMIGGLVGGAGAVAVVDGGDAWALLLGAAVLAFGQGLARAPLVAMVPRACPRDSVLLGRARLMALFRALELLGAALGPLVLAVLAAHMPRDPAAWLGPLNLAGDLAQGLAIPAQTALALALMGLAAMACAVVFGLFFLFIGPAPRRLARMRHKEAP